MKRARRKSTREPTIALINIVFLMLVFFMVAGALAPPLDPALRLVKTAELDSAAPPDALVAHSDGRLSYRGADVVSAEAWLADQILGGDTTIRIVPDRDFPASDLVGLARQLRVAGATRVVLVTEQGLE